MTPELPEILLITGDQGAGKSALARFLCRVPNALVLDPFDPDDADLVATVAHQGLVVLVTNEPVDSMVARTKGPDLGRLNWLLSNSTVIRLTGSSSERI